MSGLILSINSNTSSLQAQRQLSKASATLSSSFQKLSSGLRINRASDDAAGLAVSSSLRADTRIYSQGVRNLNDGISALNIADGTLENLSSITTRLQELAEQSANGAVSNKQRKSIDAEAQALAKEYFRISRATEFNGLHLFDGSVQGLSLQAGYGSGGSLLSSLGGALGTATFGTSPSYQQVDTTMSRDLSMSDINGDGKLDIVSAGDDGAKGIASIRLGNGDGSFGASVSYDTDITTSNALSMSDVNGDGVLDLVTAGGDATSGWATVRLGNGDGSFKASLSYQTESDQSLALAVADVNGDGALDLVTAGSNVAHTQGYASIRLGNGDGTFRSSLSYLTEASQSKALSLADVNGDSVLDLVTAGMNMANNGQASIRIGNGDGTFKASFSYSTEGNRSYALSMSDVNGDSVLDLVTAGYSNGGTVGYATIRLGNGDGSFRERLSYLAEEVFTQTLEMSDINGDGILDLLTGGSDAGGKGQLDIRLGNGDGTFKAALSYQNEATRTHCISMSDVNGDGVPDLVTSGTDVPEYRVTIRLANTKDGISPILPFSLKTQADALQALPMLKSTQDRLSTQRGQIGAFQSRISSSLNTLGSSVLQYQAAESRIADVDVAEESSTLIRTQILQQAAASVLAQVNQTPSLALSLLR